MEWNNLIGIAGIVIGVVCSYFFYRKGKKKKKIIYSLETTILISENLGTYENLKILYNDENINSLNSTIIKIKNIGNDIIEPDNFVPSMPIIIETTDSFLLKDVSKFRVYCSNSKNRVYLEIIDELHLKVNFDFLNPKDEIHITILHSGDISVSGELKQGDVKNYSNKKYEKEDVSEHDYSSTNYESKMFKPITSVMNLLEVLDICILGLMFFLLIGQEFNINSNIFSEVISIITFVIVLLLCLLIFHRKKW